METPVEDVWSLARELAATAAVADDGRAARIVAGGHPATLRQTVVALRAGTGLAEHEDPGEATVLVLQGRVRLSWTGGEQQAAPGELLVVPAGRHALGALQDAVVLLTVAVLAG
ncbi:cupin domain-containing protein [Modestobacter versicolor]|uniref:cupin domain-containing protein n=1 Tax=Modestobacter versicolor TaxID=429133 RepID=UPI0034DFDD13